mmetsp:Transcript_22865/g.27990  ORF Transcript_22865/g.27990 Transcript_22865/m.27990 type:complete len:232 (-) Transcript_22865:2300-2995(-)
MHVILAPSESRTICTVVPSLPSKSTKALSPLSMKRRMMASLTVSSKIRCAARRIGRAPNLLASEVPSRIIILINAGEARNLISRSSSARLIVSSTINSDMERRSDCPNGEKITISSIRFKNSGRIWLSSSSFTTTDISAYMVAKFCSSKSPFIGSSSSDRLFFFRLSGGVEEGGSSILFLLLLAFASSKIRLDPTLDVMTRMAFLNETVRPFPSVSIPSSINCSRMFSTSG